jgi:predicted nuclease of predicted toxin-antitoxin system
VNFKIDENLSRRVAATLRSAGHEATTVAEEDLKGAEDKELAARVKAEQRTLITLDLDFADIRAYPPEDYAGIIVLRAKKQSRRLQIAMVVGLLPLLKQELLPGHLWIAEPDRVRIIDRSGP